MANDKNFAFNVSFLKEEINRVTNLDVKLLVIHPGSHVGLGEEVGLNNIIKVLNAVITKDTYPSICLETMVPFGILGSVITYFVNPFFVSIINSINIILLNWIYYALFILFIFDLIISITIVSNIQIITSSIIKDNTEEVKNSVKRFILDKIKHLKNKKESVDKRIWKTLYEQNMFTKRFINSFPKFKVIQRLKNSNEKDDN